MNVNTLLGQELQLKAPDRDSLFRLTDDYELHQILVGLDLNSWYTQGNNILTFEDKRIIESNLNSKLGSSTKDAVMASANGNLTFEKKNYIINNLDPGIDNATKNGIVGRLNNNLSFEKKNEIIEYLDNRPTIKHYFQDGFVFVSVNGEGTLVAKKPDEGSAQIAEYKSFETFLGDTSTLSDSLRLDSMSMNDLKSDISSYVSPPNETLNKLHIWQDQKLSIDRENSFFDYVKDKASIRHWFSDSTLVVAIDDNVFVTKIPHASASLEISQRYDSLVSILEQKSTDLGYNPLGNLYSASFENQMALVEEFGNEHTLQDIEIDRMGRIDSGLSDSVIRRFTVSRTDQFGSFKDSRYTRGSFTIAEGPSGNILFFNTPKDGMYRLAGSLDEVSLAQNLLISAGYTQRS